MYLYGMLTIDPSQLTHLDRVKPTKGFARLAHLLTGGLVNTKEERETFCAVTILQQINRVMRSLKIDNLVRLSTDETVFYEDKHGVEGDLKQAFNEFGHTVSADNRHSFQRLELVLEHHTRDLGYLIDVRILRTHRVGEHPIQISINGMPKILGGEPGGSIDPGLLNDVFVSQQSYDVFVARYKCMFDEFLNDIAQAFGENMKVDDVSMSSKVKIIRPSKRINRPSDVPRSSDYVYDPIFQDYYGHADASFYAWIWADRCHTNEIHCQDCTIVDSDGADVLAVGAEGFLAAEGSTMNVDEPFALPATADLVVFHENEYAAEFFSESARSDLSQTGEAGSGGWLDSFGVSFDGGGDGGGGCGGCGGDCGG